MKSTHFVIFVLSLMSASALAETQTGTCTYSSGSNPTECNRSEASCLSIVRERALKSAGAYCKSHTGSDYTRCETITQESTTQNSASQPESWSCSSTLRFACSG